MADLLECLLQVKGLRETCDRLSNLAAAFDASRWTARPPGGGPSAIDLLGLLVELEVVHGGWLRQILAIAGPRLPAADERALLELASRHGWNVPDALDRFLAHRRASLDLLDRCSAADFSRTATHPTRRELTLADVVAVMMASDAERVGEMRRALTHEGPKVPGSEGPKV